MEILKELLLKDWNRFSGKQKTGWRTHRRGRFVYPVAEKMSSIITACRGIEKTAPIFPRSRWI